MMDEAKVKQLQAEMAIRFVKLLQPGQSITQDGVTCTRENRADVAWFCVSQGKGKKARAMSRLDLEQAATIFAFGF